jgi:CheY-like chemotaxis protein
MVVAQRPRTGQKRLFSVPNWKCPDIIVSDVIMPESNGVQLARAIRQHCPDVRVLLFSGNAATSDLLHRASQEGDLFEVLAKPVHPLQLLNPEGPCARHCGPEWRPQGTLGGLTGSWKRWG